MMECTARCGDARVGERGGGGGNVGGKGNDR
jgi:hypothetical protein